VLDGVVTPSLSTDAYLQFNASLTGNPCWTLGAGLEANVGVNVSFLSVNLLPYTSPTLNLYSTTVAQATNTCFAPVLNSITPNMALAMSPQITIALAGSNFAPDSIASFNGQQLSTTFVDANDLTAIASASDLTMAGVFPVTVTNPDNPGGTSAPVNFTVGNVTVSVSPMTAAVPVGKSQQFTATVQGSSNTGVFWSVNGSMGGNSTIGTISSVGLYTAPANVPSPAIVTVSATSQAEPSISASANVTVTTLSYTFTTIDDPSAAPYTEAFGINDTSQISGTYAVGTSIGNGVQYVGNGFLYSNGNFSTIDCPGSDTEVSGINEGGEIVGSCTGTSDSGTGFLYSNGTFTTIDDPIAAPGGTSPNGVNDSGQIVGSYIDSNGNDHGFMFSNGTFTTIDDPNGSDGTEAWGINDNGQIVGFYWDNNDTEHGFLYSDGHFTTIDDPNSTVGTEAYGINNSGQIVGSYTDSTSYDTGFLYSGGNFTTIGYPGAIYGTEAQGINSGGQIVGSYTDSNNNLNGFLATPSQ
jgi:probable HAF family extracellular repeat protein